MLAYKLNFILLPQLIATLNNYTCSLPPLAIMSTGLLLQSAFFRPCKFMMTGEMAPMEGPKCDLAVEWGPDIIPTVSTRLSRPCSGILALSGCMYNNYTVCTRHSNSKVYHCVILLLHFSLCQHPHHLCTPPTYALVYTSPNINEFHEKIVKNSENQPLYYMPG